MDFHLSKLSALAVGISLNLVCATSIAKPAPCNDPVAQQIPSRQPDAPTGVDFAKRVESMTEGDRENVIESELLAGNIPEFLRRLVPVAFGAKLADGHEAQVTICVLPDYLAVGTDLDFLFVPMRLATALTVAARYGFTLPTAKMVDAIYEQSKVHLSPQPLPAGDNMRTTDYYSRHTELIREQRASLGVLLGSLTAGDKKDLVITNRLWSNLDRVAIYGWHKLDHNPIQPLSTVHGAHYADYSHGVRLVSNVAYVDGQPKSIFSLLSDPNTANALSSEGPIRRLDELLATLATIRVGSDPASTGINPGNLGNMTERVR